MHDRQCCDLHPESLLRIPLVERMLTDPYTTLVVRAVDHTWHYAKTLRSTGGGFNLLRGEIYYGASSQIARWLVDPRGPTRGHNHEDHLLREVLFAVHDYLHDWSVRMIQSLFPSFEFGCGTLTPERIDDAVFCMLVTEAVATVGLDYWFLSTVDLNALCDIGTRVDTLTVSYRESYAEELRRFDAKFNVQCPSFFTKLTNFYLTGNWRGFDLNDFNRSPILASWLRHELEYGATQRAYSRAWMGYLAGVGEVSRRQARAPVPCGEPRHVEVIERLGVHLWELVKEEVEHLPPRVVAADETWGSSPEGRLDLRFLNLNVLDGADIEGHSARLAHADSTGYLCSQWLARHDYSSLDPGLHRLIERSLRERDFQSVRALTAGATKVAMEGPEPRDIFMPS